MLPWFCLIPCMFAPSLATGLPTHGSRSPWGTGNQWANFRPIYPWDDPPSTLAPGLKGIEPEDTQFAVMRCQASHTWHTGGDEGAGRWGKGATEHTGSGRRKDLLPALSPYGYKGKCSPHHCAAWPHPTALGVCKKQRDKPSWKGQLNVQAFTCLPAAKHIGLSNQGLLEGKRE